MDQPKIERMFRIIRLLADNTNHSLDELADTLGLSRRTMFRYLDTLKGAGFVIQSIDEGVYKIVSCENKFTDLSQIVFFSEEEAHIFSKLLDNLNCSNAMKAGLYQKLAAVYDSTSICDYIQDRGMPNMINTLARAIKEEKQVRLVGYLSGPANETMDYVVEPYAFTADYSEIWACDAASGINRVFKISKTERIELLGDWEMKKKHRPKPVDSFRMNGNGCPIERVKMRLSLRAKNLLVEEFPVTEFEISQDKRYWFWEGGINAFEGIGRFVLSLPRDTTILKGTKLKEWVAKECEYSRKKFKR